MFKALPATVLSLSIVFWVLFSGAVPNLFAEEKGVVAEGFLKDRNYFLATKILAKHDENYMPPEVKEAIGDK